MTRRLPKQGESEKEKTQKDYNDKREEMELKIRLKKMRLQNRGLSFHLELKAYIYHRPKRVCSSRQKIVYLVTKGGLIVHPTELNFFKKIIALIIVVDMKNKILKSTKNHIVKIL